MPISKREMKGVLLTKFDCREVDGGKHEKVEFHHEGTKVAMTYFSRGRNYQISDNILTAMARDQIGAGTLNFLKKMVSCEKGMEDYLARLRELAWLD